MGPAVEAGQLVREYLEKNIKASDTEFQQMQDGVELFIHKCLVAFSTPTPQNGQAISSGADYRHPARTAQEIKQTIAAEQGTVTAAKKGFKLTDDAELIAQREGLADPAAAIEPAAPAQPPPPASPVKPEGWII